MNKNSKNAENARFAALKLAEIKATDKEDFVQCTNDMVRTASLNKDEAEVVASAIRAKYLPNIAKQAGIKLAGLDLEDGKETVDFANDESDDEEMEFHHFESDEDEMNEDDDEMSDEDMDDSDEVEDSDDVATFEIEVPADMVDQAQKAVQEALDNLLGGDLESSDDDMEDMDDMDEMDSDDDDDDEDEETEKFTKNSNEVRNMTKQALAERKAQREALLRRAEREEILMKLAAEEEVYPAHSTFKYNEDMVNMEGEIDYPSMSFEGGEGNSLKEQNPSYAEQRVPTNNPDSLQFPDVTKPMKFEGSGDGSLEYVVDWESLENPSEGLEDANLFEVPTQMPSMPHKTTKANAENSRVAKKHDVECKECGHRQSMTEAEMEDEATRCANKDCPSNMKEGGMDEHDAVEDKKAQNQPVDPNKVKTDIGNLGTAQQTAKNVDETIDNFKGSSSLDLARIKTSYGCASKLALAGIITSEEVDSYAEQMLNDGLKADSMIRQTKLLLKSAQTSTERVAAAAAEKMTKTASTLGVSTSPAFNGSFASNSAALDIQSALKGTWTMPKLED